MGVQEISTNYTSSGEVYDHSTTIDSRLSPDLPRGKRQFDW
jgi:hypothetical protein